MAKVTAMFYAVLILGVLAVGLHIVGYTTPGWLILTRKFEVEEIKITTDVLMKQSFMMEEIETGPTDPDRPKIDEGGMDDGMPESHPPKPPHQEMKGPRPSPHHIAMIEETTEIQEWIKASVEEIDHVYMKLKFGLWKSKMCIAMRIESLDDEGDADMAEDSSSSSSDSGHGRKKHCRCKKMSTKCALNFVPMFMSTPEDMEIEAEGGVVWYNYNPKYFLGNTCLTEHRVESTIGLSLLVIAVITGVLAFRKVDSCRCWAFTCLICLLVSFVLITVPVHRVLLHNYRHQGKDLLTNSDTHCPYSLLASLVGAATAFILAIAVAVALCRRRRTIAKHWNRFENETDSTISEEKKSGLPPSLVFIPEALTGKSGLYDIWGGVKPVEAVEPEKKPLE